MPEIRPEDFDLQIRSMLSDAGMKPSRRVWKDVSRRLDAEAAPAPMANPWAWAKWAGVCLAAAAAIAAGVFLFDPIPTYHNIQKAETLAQVTEIQSPETAVSREQPSERVIADNASPAPSAVAMPRSASAAPSEEQVEACTPVSESHKPEVTAPEEAVSEKAAAETAVSEEAAAPAAKEKHAGETFEDPFARMAWEDSRAAKATRPTQLYAGGAIGGNDSDFASTARISRLSSSVAMAKSGITELGDPSFGIPFTVGLGTRFYVAPKFSLGTGIDYSLLTSSFEGRYNNVNGGIIEQTASGTFFHAMHYIGIPVNAYYDFVSGGRIKFYGYAGGAAEYCVANKYTLYSEKFTYSEPVKGLQWSVGAGLGVEFRLTDFLGIYVDPGVRYYFESGHPRSVRTEHPVLVNFNAGLRFGL